MVINVALLLLLSFTFQSGGARPEPARAQVKLKTGDLVPTAQNSVRVKTTVRSEVGAFLNGLSPKKERKAAIATKDKILSKEEEEHMAELKKLGTDMVNNSKAVEQMYGDIKHQLDTYKEVLKKVVEKAKVMVVQMPDVMGMEEKALTAAELERTKPLLKVTQMIRDECPDCPLDPVVTYKLGQVVEVPSPQGSPDTWSLGTVKEVEPPSHSGKNNLVVELLDGVGPDGEFLEKKVPSQWWPTHVRLPKAASYAYKLVGKGRCAKKDATANDAQGPGTAGIISKPPSVPPTNYYQPLHELTEESCRKECDSDPNCVGYDAVALSGNEEKGNCHFYATVPSAVHAAWEFHKFPDPTNKVKGDEEDGVACYWKTKPI